MSSTVVHVKNISHETSEKEVRDFFSFCGKITSLSVTPTSDSADSVKSATVTFEKETAAKTALLLDNTQLGPSQVQVSSAANLDDIAKDAHADSGDHHDGGEIGQEDKPRSRIVAEYLAQGYKLSDNALQKAIALDNKHGISSRFTNALTNFDSKYKATDKAKGIDASYGITDKSLTAWKGLNTYFEKALETPTGQKLAAFYTKGNKEVVDIHNEARRLAGLNKSATTTATDEKGAITKCTCGGSSGICTCAEGKCTCSGCAKDGPGEKTGGEQTATGQADTFASSSGIPPLSEKS